MPIKAILFELRCKGTNILARQQVFLCIVCANSHLFDAYQGCFDYFAYLCTRN